MMECLSNWINDFTAAPIELVVVCGIIWIMVLFICFQEYKNYRLKKEIKKLKGENESTGEKTEIPYN